MKYTKPQLVKVADALGAILGPKQGCIEDGGGLATCSAYEADE